MPGTPIDTRSIDGSRPEGNPSLDKVFEISVSDIARYQEQLIKMILHHDERALKVLSLYVTVLGALVTALFALKSASLLTSHVLVPMLAAASTLSLGCGLAYRAAWTARIFLPGRKPDFWIWAFENQQTLAETITAYARQADEVIVHNEKVADRAAGRLTKAYICGLAVPVVAAAAEWVFYWS